MFLESRLCPLKTVLVHLNLVFIWVSVGPCHVIHVISVICAMYSVSSQKEYIENKIKFSTVQRYVTKIFYSQNILTQVSVVLNCYRARRQQVLARVY